MVDNLESGKSPCRPVKHTELFPAGDGLFSPYVGYLLQAQW